MRAILTDKKKTALFRSWSVSRFEAGFRILHLQSEICDHLHFIFSSKIVLKSASHSSGSVLVWLHCCPCFTYLQYAPSVPIPVKQRWWPVGDLWCSADQAIACFAPSCLSYWETVCSTDCTTQVLMGAVSNSTPCEMVQVRSWRPGLRCWWAVRLWCTGLGAERHWGGQWSVGRECMGGRNLKRMRLCDIVHGWKSWRAQGAAKIWGCIGMLDGGEVDHKNLKLSSGPWSACEEIFFRSAVCLTQGYFFSTLPLILLIRFQQHFNYFIAIKRSVGFFPRLRLFQTKWSVYRCSIHISMNCMYKQIHICLFSASQTTPFQRDRWSIRRNRCILSITTFMLWTVIANSRLKALQSLLHQCHHLDTSTGTSKGSGSSVHDMHPRKFRIGLEGC